MRRLVLNVHQRKHVKVGFSAAGHIFAARPIHQIFAQCSHAMILVDRLLPVGLVACCRKPKSRGNFGPMAVNQSGWNARDIDDPLDRLNATVRNQHLKAKLQMNSKPRRRPGLFIWAPQLAANSIVQNVRAMSAFGTSRQFGSAP